jgi:hypothetical protein
MSKAETREDPGHNSSSTAPVCRKRRLNGVVLRMRPEKLSSRVTVGVEQ